MTKGGCQICKLRRRCSRSNWTGMIRMMINISERNAGAGTQFVIIYLVGFVDCHAILLLSVLILTWHTADERRVITRDLPRHPTRHSGRREEEAWGEPRPHWTDSPLKSPPSTGTWQDRSSSQAVIDSTCHKFLRTCH